MLDWPLLFVGWIRLLRVALSWICSTSVAFAYFHSQASAIGLRQEACRP
jgi:hypothetical protein